MVEGIQVTQAALAVQAVQAVEEDAVAVAVGSNKYTILSESCHHYNLCFFYNRHSIVNLLVFNMQLTHSMT